MDQLTPAEYEIVAVQIDKDSSKGQQFIRKIKFGEEKKNEKTEDKSDESNVELKDDQEVGQDQQGVESGSTEGGSVFVSPEVVIDSPTSNEVQEELKKVEKKEAFLLVMKKDSVGYYKEQTNGIETIGGESVEILLRPKQEVHSVVGRLYEVSKGEEKVSLLQKVKNWLMTPVYAGYDTDLQEWVGAYVFEYDELHNIYRVDIETPDNNGNEYQLVISMNNEDGSRIDLKKNLSIAYKGRIKSGDDNVSYARVEVFRQNEESGEYVKWDAELYGSKNPIFTDGSGKYAAQLPPGAYYFNVAAPGYENYQSKIYLLAEPMVINDEINMERGSYSSWFRFWGWVKRNT